jgi:hypothetical protein
MSTCPASCYLVNFPQVATHGWHPKLHLPTTETGQWPNKILPWPPGQMHRLPKGWPSVTILPNPHEKKVTQASTLIEGAIKSSHLNHQQGVQASATTLNKVDGSTSGVASTWTTWDKQPRGGSSSRTTTQGPTHQEGRLNAIKTTSATPAWCWDATSLIRHHKHVLLEKKWQDTYRLNWDEHT